MSQSEKDIGQTHDMLQRLQNLGIDREDAWALRRISMTLHRWHELECGDSDSWSSWTVTRGHKRKNTGKPGYTFEHDDNGSPFMEVHRHRQTGSQPVEVAYNAIPDRERGAQKRLAAIMARYPGLTAYVQGDPRGAALYILRASDIPEGASIDSCYSRGVAVFK